jgi:hypothetical protein
VRRLSSLSVLLALVVALALPGTAAGAVLLNTKDFPQSATVSVPCANGGQGDTFSFDGFIHAVVTETIPPAGRATATSHFNTYDLKATSASTGVVYQITGRVELGTTWLVGGTQAVTVDRTMVFQNAIGAGPSNNTYFMFTAHLTVTPSGAVVVDVSDTTIACR